MLYTIIDKYPNLIANYKFTDCEIAAANYLLMVANLWGFSGEITDGQAGAIKVILSVHPMALELIRDLKAYEPLFSEETCKLCQLVSENNKIK